jgi:outer membrane protein assembly factor BamA
LHEFDPDLIIASLTLAYDTTAGISVIDVVTRTTSMAGFEDIQQQKNLADVVIEPDLASFGAQDYARAQEIIEAGESAAEKALPALRELLSGRKPLINNKEITHRHVPSVRSVRFDGLQETRERTITREIRTAPGMSLCFDRLVDDMERLFQTGLFNGVNYRLESLTKDSVDVVFEVQEKAYGFYLLGLRYDNMNNATLGLEIGQSNLFGTGLCLRTACNLGDPNEYRLGLTDTRILTLPLGYRTDFFWNSIDRSYFENHIWQAEYNTDTRGALGEIGYFVGRKSYFSLDFHAYQALYRLPELDFFDTLPSTEWIVGPGYNLEFNNHDDIYFPQCGANYRMKVFHAFTKLGASNNFLRLEVNLDQYIPLSSRFLIHAGLDFGVSSGELPWAEYFQTGGANFVGFMVEEFTTENKAVLRLGFDFRLFSILGQNDPIYFQLLSNIASFKPHADLLDLNHRSLRDFDLGVGAGIRTNTPIGPLQIALGVGNPHRLPREDHIQFIVYLSLGRDFRYTK